MLPAAVSEGIERFNRGEWFEAHEWLEEAWRAEGDPLRRRLWHGLVQLAVGFTHLARGNVAGARTLLAQGRAKLADLRPAACGIELAELFDRVGHCEQAIEQLAGEAAAFDWALAPRIERAESA